MTSMTDEAAQAMGLAQKLWSQIERRRWSSGTDGRHGGDAFHHSGARGLHGYLDYYRGQHSLRFASDQFEDYFKRRFEGFSDNWCAPVIDAAGERLNWYGIRLGDANQADADEDFGRVMEVNSADSGSSEALTVAMATGRSMGMVWGNQDDEQTPRVTWEHPEMCALSKDPDTGLYTASAKGWLDDHKGYLTLYTADAIWKWQWAIADDNDPRKNVDWQPRQGLSDDTWPIKNPLGRQPMVEFRNQSLLDDKPISDLAGVAAMQDAINLLWAYLFNALDFASLPQRVVTGAELPKIPVLDADGQIVGTKNADLKKLMDDRILWVTDPNSKIQSWPAAALDVFTTVIETAVDHIASQTRTPPHYLMGKMSNTAAESLTVAETGLVAKVTQRQQYFTRPLREMHALVALAQGDPTKAKAAMGGKILWQNPGYRSLAQMTDAFQKMRQAGMPLRWMLEWYGLPPGEVNRVMAMAKEESDILVAAQPIKAAPGKVLPRGNSVETVDSPDATSAEAAVPAPTS